MQVSMNVAPFVGRMLENFLRDAGEFTFVAREHFRGTPGKLLAVIEAGTSGLPVLLSAGEFTGPGRLYAEVSEVGPTDTQPELLLRFTTWEA